MLIQGERGYNQDKSREMCVKYKLVYVLLSFF